MPTLHDIENEIGTTEAPLAADLVRRRHLRAISDLTGRATVIYASAFTVRDDLPGQVLGVDRQDVQGFMSALHGLTGNALDLIVHSPGGTASATEQIVNYLRKKFEKIRVIVPQNAMSAATMLACAADQIVMGKHSALGPIDPQLLLSAPGGGSRRVPAQSILDEFDEAQRTINDPANNPVMWVRRIGDYPPGVLADCKKVIILSKTLVAGWLEKYMFAGEPIGEEKSRAIAEWLGDNKNFYTHDRSIGIDLARSKGLVVEALEADQNFQEAVLSTFHAIMATFKTTNLVKPVESDLGRGYYWRLRP